MLIKTDEHGFLHGKDHKGHTFFFDLTVTVKTAVAKTLFNFKLSLIKLLNSVTEVEIINIYASMLDWLPVFN